MIGAITKLKRNRKKLLKERSAIDKKVKKIDIAIEKFEEGIKVLHGKDEVKSTFSKAKKTRKRKTGLKNEIEKILQESDQAIHISEIMNILGERAYKTKKSTVSATLQIYTKRGKFEKTAPATFTLATPKSEVAKVKIIGKL